LLPLLWHSSIYHLSQAEQIPFGPLTLPGIEVKADMRQMYRIIRS
jgi:hypothetical protein